MSEKNYVMVPADLLDVLQELRESADYWSEYDVPCGIVERMDAALSKVYGMTASGGLTALSETRGDTQPAPTAAAVPEGWRVVPLKPEIEMVEAGYEASLGMPDRSRHAMVIEMYEAMLAAAPSPEVVEREDESLRKDAERYRWLRGRLVGASFDWDGEGMTALAFEMPGALAVVADCDTNIDTAIALSAQGEGGA